MANRKCPNRSERPTCHVSCVSPPPAQLDYLVASASSLTISRLRRVTTCVWRRTAAAFAIDVIKVRVRKQNQIDRRQLFPR